MGLVPGESLRDIVPEGSEGKHSLGIDPAQVLTADLRCPGDALGNIHLMMKTSWGRL
jgi:hypothetical protein